MQAREIVLAIFPEATCVCREGEIDVHFDVLLHPDRPRFVSHPSSELAWRLALKKIRQRADETIVIREKHTRFRKGFHPPVTLGDAMELTSTLDKTKISTHGWKIGGRMLYAAHWKEGDVERQTALIFESRAQARQAAREAIAAKP